MAPQGQEHAGQDDEDRRLLAGVSQSELGDILKRPDQGGQEGTTVDEEVVVFVPCNLPNLYAEHPIGAQSTCLIDERTYCRL